MAKIASIPNGIAGVLAPRTNEFLDQIYKIYPLLEGVARDSSGNFLIGGKKISEVGLPSDLDDALTLGFYNLYNQLFLLKSSSFLTGGGYKVFCVAASTSNVPLTGSAPLVVDGVPFVATSTLAPIYQVLYALFGPAVLDVALTWGRILLKNQTNPAENGIYDIQVADGNYSLVKSIDCKNGYDFVAGTVIPVLAGATNAVSLWQASQSDWNPFNPFEPISVQFKRISPVLGAKVDQSSGASSTTDIKNKFNEILGSLRTAGTVAS
jgi:hypothetical protein